MTGGMCVYLEANAERQCRWVKRTTTVVQEKVDVCMHQRRKVEKGYGVRKAQGGDCWDQQLDRERFRGSKVSPTKLF